MPTTATAPQLFVVDQRMLELLDFCLANELGGVSTTSYWCDKIGFVQQNLSSVRRGTRGFADKHLLAAGQIFGISMDWLFGFSSKMFRAEQKTALDCCMRLLLRWRRNYLTVKKAKNIEREKSTPRWSSFSHLFLFCSCCLPVVFCC